MIEVSLEDRIAELDEEISQIEKTLKEKQDERFCLVVEQNLEKQNDKI
jgi:septal ring factor EnvC (AmiA/AmiB activator)